MTAKRTKLELTWIGKEDRPRLEPRIFLEDRSLSYHAAEHKTNSKYDNRLICGDNLLALKALTHEFSGRVKCIYVDPPFNTQQAFEHYDDGVEHSIWLQLMRDRLELLRELLTMDGSLFVHIDDNELGYLIVLLDEVFGRSNRMYTITFRQGSATGHKSINPGCVNTTNFILLYARDKSRWTPNRIFTARDRDTRYGQYIENVSDSWMHWRLTTLLKAYAHSRGITDSIARVEVRENPQLMDDFVLLNAASVVQLARPDYENVSAELRRLIVESSSKPNDLFRLERAGYSDIYLKGGKRILFYSDKLKLIDGKRVAGEPLTTLWDDILSNNLHAEGGVAFPKGKKPEALLKRVLEMTTVPGDLVLDSFAGSGTTGAVAHKMGRQWIMIELGEHAETHIVPRMKNLIEGNDSAGITESVGWQGGGGFRFFRLAPSLLKRDRWNNWIVNKEFNAEMLAEAVCKLESFTYAPSQETWWQHGHSTESDFIYVTTQTLTQPQLAQISDEVGPERTLLVCCGSFRANAAAFPNLTMKKIPKAVLHRCEWGRDDYSLEIAALPETAETVPALTKPPSRKRPTARKSSEGPTLFSMDAGEPVATEEES